VANTDAASWQSKVDRFFIHAATYHRRVATLSRSELPKDQAKANKMKSNLPRRLLEEATKLGDQRRAEGHAYRIVTTSFGYDALPPGSVIPFEDYMRDRFALFGYRRTRAQLIQERNAHALGHIEELMWKGKFYPRSVDDWPTKTNRDHYLLMALLVNCEREPLGKRELAACFDEVCPCGLRFHSEESLRQLRSEIVRDSVTPIVSCYVESR
jgi:hypothetical protein